MERTALLEIIADQKKQLVITNIIERECFKELDKSNQNKFIHIISGVRRSGKSTLLQYIRTKTKDKDYYMNFDDERLVNFGINDFQALYEIFLEQFGKQKIFYFDEIQNIIGWERFVRRLYESGNKIYITGSNANLLSKELGTHLTGRYIKTELYPFSFKEYLLFKNIKNNNINFLSTEEKISFKKTFSVYLEQGGFPEFLQSNNTEYLKNLFESLLYKDIIVRHKLPNEKTLKELAVYCASNLGKPISYNNLKQLFNVGSATSIKEYLSYFENSYLFFTIPRYDSSFKKQIYAPKKVYCIDTRLAKEIGFHFSLDQGRYLENIVFLELMRKNQTIFYHQDKKECDFIIKKGAKIVFAIQVTSNLENSERKRREMDGLIEAMEKYNLNEGLILTENEEKEEKIQIKGKQTTIHILPIWKWLLINEI